MADLFEGIAFASVHFCGTCYRFAFHEGAFLYDLAAVYELLQDLRRRNGHRLHFRTGGFQQPFWDNTLATFKELNCPGPSDLNEVLDAPIVLQFEEKDYFTNIRLASVNFPQIMPPEQAFMQIYNFIIPAEAEPDANPNDMNRYEAKGFDRKTSFRKTKAGK